MTSVLSLLVPSHFDMLTRVTGLFSRRGFNIKALSVGETEDPEISRITILTEGDGPQLKQIHRQVSKLEEVKTAAIIPAERLLDRELMLIKLSPESAGRQELMRLVNNSSAKIAAQPDGYSVIEVTGTKRELDSFVDQMRPFGIIELSRTGVTALELSDSALYCHRP